jgi:hypothetical protein
MTVKAKTKSEKSTAKASSKPAIKKVKAMV